MPFPTEYYEDPGNAATYLAEHLTLGTLALIIGAGATMPLGLPRWEDLIDICLHNEGLDPRRSDDLELEASRLANHCTKKTKRDIRDVVEAGLYAHGRLSLTQLTTSSRLGAFGALLMGSRRGSVQTVITFNYDSVLEEYLALHGYTARIVTTLPCLHGAEDVTIFHPHGYLPAHPELGHRSSKLTLTKESFNELLGDPASPWVHFIRHVVRTKVLLVVGLSPASLAGGALGPILQHEAKKSAAIGPIAIALYGPGMDNNYSDVLRNQKVAAVSLPSFDDIDTLMLSVCQAASKRIPPPEGC
jgi:hypothetical protein